MTPREIRMWIKILRMSYVFTHMQLLYVVIDVGRQNEHIILSAYAGICWYQSNCLFAGCDGSNNRKQVLHSAAVWKGVSRESGRGNVSISKICPKFTPCSAAAISAEADNKLKLAGSFGNVKQSPCSLWQVYFSFNVQQRLSETVKLRYLKC